MKTKRRLTARAGAPKVHTMTATITLKVDAKEKKRLQREARRANQSLNAYMLRKVAIADASSGGKIDWDKLTERFAGRFVDEEAWRMIPGRE